MGLSLGDKWLKIHLKFGGKRSCSPTNKKPHLLLLVECHQKAWPNLTHHKRFENFINNIHLNLHWWQTQVLFNNLVIVFLQVLKGFQNIWTGLHRDKRFFIIFFGNLIYYINDKESPSCLSCNHSCEVMKNQEVEITSFKEWNFLSIYVIHKRFQLSQSRSSHWRPWDEKLVGQQICQKIHYTCCKVIILEVKSTHEGCTWVIFEEH
jgi:hypothetical protein